jgi:hypothetical protein
MANNYQSPEIVTMARRLMEEEGLTPDQALAKAQMIMNLPAEGLQGAMTGPALEAYKQANPMDFMTDAQKGDILLNQMQPNNPMYDPGFQQYRRDNPRTAADEAYTTLAREGMDIEQLRGMTDEEILRELQRLRQRQSTMDRSVPGLFNLDLSTSF